MHGDDFLAGFIRATIRKHHQNFLDEMKKRIENPREFFECHPSIKTNITDKDLLLMHIDIALDSGDEKQFKLLTEELKATEGAK